MPAEAARFVTPRDGDIGLTTRHQQRRHCGERPAQWRAVCARASSGNRPHHGQPGAGLAGRRRHTSDLSAFRRCRAECRRSSRPQGERPSSAPRLIALSGRAKRQGSPIGSACGPHLKSPPGSGISNSATTAVSPLDMRCHPRPGPGPRRARIPDEQRGLCLAIYRPSHRAAIRRSGRWS